MIMRDVGLGVLSFNVKIEEEMKEGFKLFF